MKGKIRPVYKIPLLIFFTVFLTSVFILYFPYLTLIPPVFLGFYISKKVISQETIARIVRFIFNK
jgi:hypothetical protein